MELFTVLKIINVVQKILVVSHFYNQGITMESRMADNIDKNECLQRAVN